MSDILSFFSNTIVLGVISSLIASTIIFFLSKFFFRRKVNKEKVQRIAMARKDVIYAVRPMILEKKLIPNSQLSLFLSSIAKQYEVDAMDIYNYQSLSEDLIKEIMLNPMLTTESRIEYCSFIETFLKTGEERNNIISSDETLPMANSIHRLSVSVAMLAALFSIILTLLSSDTEISNEIRADFGGIPVNILIVLSIVSILFILLFVRKVDVTKVLTEILEDDSTDEKKDD